MPPVSYLLRFRCSYSRSFCKRSTAIPADNLYTRMGHQPLLEGLSLPVGKQVDRHPLFEIDEDRSIAPAATKAKIIHAQHPRGGHLTFLLLANQPQQRLWTSL